MSKASRILAIDPGPERSAWVLLVDGNIHSFDIWANHRVRDELTDTIDERIQIAIEEFAPYGQSLGWESLKTIKWIARFDHYETAHMILRMDVRGHLCGRKTGVTDSDISNALAKRYGHDSIRSAKGTKKNPGPLYGFKSHLWSALAVGVTYYDQREGRQNDA